MSRLRRSASRKAAPPNATTRWRNLLFNGVPFTGNLLRQLALDSLADRARAGDILAAQSLAECAASELPDSIRAKALSAIEALDWQPAIDSAWQVWVDTRNSDLEKLLTQKNKPAGHPFPVRALSLLKLKALSTAAHVSLIPAIITASQDRDEEIRTGAVQVLRNLTSQAAINELFSQWAATRAPSLAAIIAESRYAPEKPAALRTLAGLCFHRPEWVDQEDPETVRELVRASAEPDETIATAARQILRSLESAPAIDTFCLAWSRDRDPVLEEILCQAGYVAQQPLSVRYLTALLNGNLDIPVQAGPNDLAELLDACQDPNPVISANARRAVFGLVEAPTRSALCEIAMASDKPEIQKLALEAGFLPQQPDRQALFLFLTGQFDRYDLLDFDQRLMRAAYETADASLKRRITRAVQSAGKTAYLEILSGVDLYSGEAGFGDEDIQTVIRILAGNREWTRLWPLVFQVRLEHAIQILRLLSENGWQPEKEDERSLFARAVALACTHLTIDRIPLEASIPPAIRRSTLKTNGRINDIAFCPGHPLLALGTGSGKIVLWNSQKSEIAQTYSDSNQSIGRLAYTPAGDLISAGRDAVDAACWIERWVDGHPVRIGMHTGPVTSLFAHPEGSLITTGRDQRVARWDLDRCRLLGEALLPDWPRGAALSPKGDRLVILHQWFSILDLPGLQATRFSARSESREIQKSVNRSAAFSPDGSTLLLGQYNGQVVQYRHLEGTSGARRRLVTEHPKEIVAVRFLPDHPLFLTADSSGEIRFHTWPDLRMYKSIQVPAERLTSVHVSPDGAFLAAGSSDSLLTLWDLRVLDLPDVLTLPLQKITPGQLAAVISLLEYDPSAITRLPRSVENALELLRLLLQHRYQYEILVDEIPVLGAGEFDILIEG